MTNDDLIDPSVELAKTMQSGAGLIARCILSGMKEPDSDFLGQDAMIGQSIMLHLVETWAEMPTRFPDRLARAFAWTIRDDISFEFALHTGMQLVSLVQDLKLTELVETIPEYQQFRAKFADFL